MRRHVRQRALAALAAVVLASVAVVIVADPFAGSGKSSGVSDNGAPISFARVNRESLSQQTQVSATLGYALYAALFA